MLLMRGGSRGGSISARKLGREASRTTYSLGKGPWRVKEEREGETKTLSFPLTIKGSSEKNSERSFGISLKGSLGVVVNSSRILSLAE